MAANGNWIPKSLQENKSVLSEAEWDFATNLIKIGQGHLFDAWPAPGTKDAEKKKILEQARTLDGQYPGGLAGYVKSALSLLADARDKVNPYDGYTPSVPAGERLAPGTPEWDQSEASGMGAIGDTCFVLVAGGLGERLGYDGIKVDLPADITTGTCYLGLYVKFILALQARARQQAGQENKVIPLCIMTSGDTHEKTVRLLDSNNNFGAAEGQIVIVKQEKVPALKNNDAQFACVKDNDFEIETKPHGHGDIHTLLHMNGLVGKWAGEGRKWIVFFQDTNGLVFRAITAALGVSVRNSFDVNTLTVPRKPGEAVGGICRLTHSSGKAITINVEYNQLDPLLRATVNPKGDLADDSGFSPYPGNTNVLIFALNPYKAVLDRTGGAIPEFVNPKYTDEARSKFTPTRLECMMQDYPKLLDAAARVGFTQIDRWISFSAVKNNLVDAAKKVAQTGVGECASTGEADIYYANRKVLADHGVRVGIDGPAVKYSGIPINMGARVVLMPDFGTTLSEIRGHFPNPAKVKLSDRSTLVLEGDVTIEELELDGALTIRAQPGASVRIRSLHTTNAGWEFEAIEQGSSHHAKYQIRGYVLKKNAAGLTLDLAGPGRYTVYDPPTNTVTTADYTVRAPTAAALPATYAAPYPYASYHSQSFGAGPAYY